MPYRYLEDVSIADVAFEAMGNTLNEMFDNAGLAVTNTMVRDLKSVKPTTTKTVKIASDNIEKLLFEFLQEFVFWKDKSLLLFSSVSTKIEKKNGRYFLTAKLSGEKLDMKKHELLVDVKAVTWHLFNVKKAGKKWRCQVVLDV